MSKRRFSSEILQISPSFSGSSIGYFLALDMDKIVG